MEDTANNVNSVSSAPKLRASVENKGIEEYLVTGCRTLEAARLNVDIAERLYAYGIDDEEMAIGLALHDAAKDALRAHRESQHSTTAAVTEEALKGGVAKARDTFATFRGIARAAFSGLTDRLNLKLVGEPPDDLQRFIDSVHVAYMTASREPYTEKLSKRGYPPEKLGAYCEELDALAQTGEEHAEAAGESNGTNTAAQRDRTYNAFKEFMKEFKGIAQTVFRREPEQLKKLGL